MIAVRKSLLAKDSDVVGFSYSHQFLTFTVTILCCAFSTLRCDQINVFPHCSEVYTGNQNNYLIWNVLYNVDYNLILWRTKYLFARLLKKYFQFNNKKNKRHENIYKSKHLCHEVVSFLVAGFVIFYNLMYIGRRSICWLMWREGIVSGTVYINFLMQWIENIIGKQFSSHRTCWKTR